MVLVGTVCDWASFVRLGTGVTFGWNICDALDVLYIIYAGTFPDREKAGQYEILQAESSS